MYGVIDTANSYDLAAGVHVDRSRARTAKNYYGQEDAGHLMRVIWDTDDLSLIRASQGGAISTAPPGKYICHYNLVEVEYLISGAAIFHYPGEDPVPLRAGDCVCQHRGQPHSMETTSIAPAELAVILSGLTSSSDRNKIESEQEMRHSDGHGLSRAGERKTLLDDDVMHVEELFSRNEMDLSVCLAAYRPGICGVEDRYVRNRNADEIILVTGGRGTVKYPDGREFPLYRDISLYHSRDQARLIRSDLMEPLTMLGIYSCHSFEELQRD